MTQKPILFNTGITDVLLVEVPEGADSFKVEISVEDDFYEFSYMHQIDDEDSGFYGEWEEVSIDIPQGLWQSLGIASAMSEEVAAEIVPISTWANGPNEGKQAGYYYYGRIPRMNNFCKTALEALQTICQSHNIPFDRTVILIPAT